jgi:hypothetical protein
MKLALPAWCASAFLASSLSCIVSTAGAPCLSDQNCPSDQYCAFPNSGGQGTCQVGPRGTGGDGGADAGTDAGSATDAGVPAASLSSTSVSFGAVSCGASANKSVTLQNKGTADLTYSAKTVGAAFSIPNGSGTVPPGGSTPLTVTATVGSSAAAAASYSGVLIVDTNDPANPALTVALLATAQGATLLINPSIVSFGVVTVNTAASPATVTVTNVGNAGASISYGTPSDPQFSVRWSGADGGTDAGSDGGPGSVMLAQTAGAALQIGFAPTKAGASSISVPILVNGPVCGASATSIQLNGQGTKGPFGLSSSDLTFGNNGEVNCGNTAASQAFVISNSGAASYDWTATLGLGTSSPFSLSPPNGTIQAMGKQTVMVVPAAIPMTASTADEGYSDVVTINTDIPGDTPHAVRLHETAAGAVLSFQPASIDFGGVPTGSSSNAPFSVMNAGNLGANVSLGSTNGDFSVDQPGPTLVAGAASLNATATFTPGSSTVAQNATLTLSVGTSDVLCAPLPSPLALSGTGTSGTVSYSPVALDFGSVNCGTTAMPQTVTFSNTGNQSYTISPVLGLGGASPYSISMAPTSGVVAPGGMATITVTPGAVPARSPVTPNLYGDTLTVSTNVMGDVPHQIALRETAQGAILAISTNNLAFGSTVIGQSGSYQFTVSNSGNAPAIVTYQDSPGSVFGVPGNFNVGPQAAVMETATFSPTSATMYSDMATISVSAQTVLCQPLPYSMASLSGTGIGGTVISVSPTSLDFHQVNCGSQGTAQTVTVINNSSNSLMITCKLANGSTDYTVSCPTSLSMGAMGTVTVTPQPIPKTASTAADAFADTLTITGTGGPVDESHTVSLHETALGAILAINPPQGLSFYVGTPLGQCAGSQPFTVNNSGNLEANYTLTLGGNDSADFSDVSGSPAPANGAGNNSANFCPPDLAVDSSFSATISVSTSTVLCAPLPSPMPLGGTTGT